MKAFLVFLLFLICFLGYPIVFTWGSDNYFGFDPSLNKGWGWFLDPCWSIGCLYPIDLPSDNPPPILLTRPPQVITLPAVETL